MNFESLYNPVDGKIEDAPEDFENLPDASQGEMALPKSDPGFFDGMTDTWKAPLSAGLKSLAGFETSLAETNVVGSGLQMYETETGDAIENPEEREKQITARIEEEAREHRELAQREYGLDPETSGFAAQMMFGLAETLPKAVGYSILGGPVGGAAGFGVDIGASTYGELRDKGVDKGTAAVAGLTSGALNAIGVLVPATFGRSRAQSATIGALANFGLTGAELAGVSFALASQDYDDLADQYGLNWTSLATSAVFGGVFGGAMYRAPRANAYKPFNEAQRKSVYDFMYEQLKAVGGEYANEDVASTQARLHAVGVENLARKVGLSYEQTMEIAPSIVRDDGSLETSAFNQIIGVEGANSLDWYDKKGRINALNAAKEMTANGVDAKEVKLATGWEVGTDGKWRYEIPDGKWINGMPEDGTYRVSDIIDAPELFQAYPWLRQMNITFQKGGEFDGVFLDGDEGLVINSSRGLLADVSQSKLADMREELDVLERKIELGLLDSDKEFYEAIESTPEAEAAKLKKRIADYEKHADKWRGEDDEVKLRVIVHEIQHAIQGFEKFARGGNEAMFSTRDEIVSDIRYANERLREADRALEYQAEFGVGDDATFEGRKIVFYKEDKDYYTKQLAELNDKLENYREPFEQYWSLMGEVEARNASKRYGMTEEERRGSLLSETEDVAREDQILLSNSENWVSLSLSEVPQFELIKVAESEDGTSHYVYGVNGNPNLTVLPSGVPGIRHLPIRLQKETMEGKHISNHEDEVIKAGYKSIEHAIWDITQNYWQIYEGTTENGLALVRPFIEPKSNKRGILLVDLQEVAGAYRVGTVYVSSNGRYLKKRKLLWDKSHTNRLTQESRTRGFTGPQQQSDIDSIAQAFGLVNKSFKQENRGSYNPVENKIKLTPNANLSTFSHEMGHWYLDTMFKLSGRGSADLDGDVATLLREFGIKSVDDWNKLGVEGQRKYQEQFASWLEVYLSKGEAPKPTLERLFERVKEWILDVYESLGGTQKAVEGRFESEFGTKLPEMSEEVKGVMDRLFAERKAKQKATRATSDQVAAARVVLDDYVRDERLKRILAKVEAGKRISSEDRKYWASVTRAMQVATQQLMEGRPVDVSAQMSDVPLDGKVVAKAQEKFVSEFEKANTKPAAKNDGTIESAEPLVEDPNVESALNDVQEALAQVRNENGEPVFDADAIRQGVDVAKRVVDAIGEVQARIDEVRALDAEQAVQTETVEAKREASRALLGDDGQQVMLHNIGQEMPDMAYEVEDGNGNVVKMTVAEIEAVQSSILEQAEIDKAAMGKAVECVLNNQGI